MKPDNDNREPIEVLYDIERKIEESRSITELEPRTPVDVGTPRYDTLKCVRDRGPITVNGCDEHVDHAINKISASATRLYRSYALNRSKNSDGEYMYAVTPLGKKMLQTEQQTLESSCNDAEDAGASDTPPEWEGTGLTKHMYYALKALDNTNGNPTTADMADEFIRLTELTAESGSSYRISPYMTRLKRDGYVDRTPNRPYHYWITERGRDALSG